MDLKAHIRDIPDFPKPGIVYRDITPLLGNATALAYAIEQLAAAISPLRPDYIAGIESRGFIFGMPLAMELGLGFVPIRKPGKLPAATYSAEYALEYGQDRLEIHQDSYPAGSRVLVVDDLIATGGTAAATSTLVKQAGGELVGFAFVIELLALAGRQQLPGVPVQVLLQY